MPITRSFYRIPKLSGRIVGIWPVPMQSCFTHLRFALSLAVVALGAVGENLYGFVYVSKLVVALEAFCPGSTKAVCVLKMIVFFIRSGSWYRLVQRLYGMLWVEEQHNEDKRIVERLSTTANRFSLLLLVSGSMTNTAFNVTPLLIHAYRRWLSLPGSLGLPFNIILPAFATEWPLFPLTYGVLTASGACTVFVFSFVDGFFLCSCLYICAVFRLIQQDIRRTFTDLYPSPHPVEFYSPLDNAQIRAKLSAIIDRHNAIIDLCTDLTRQFTVIILMHFLSAAFVLCSTILDIMLNTSSLSGLTYICYTVAAGTQLFLYCYGGNHVNESSAAVADTLYDIEWYKCDVRTRKMILMILRRSQRAKTIGVPFFTPSLPAFSSILSTTGSYITLLKTFL